MGADPAELARHRGDLPYARLPCYLLAGGESRRFGSDKARSELDGVPLLVHAARSLAPCSSDCTVVADSAGKYEDLGLRTIADQVLRKGPLGGLHAALTDLRARGGGQWALLSSCDRIGLRCSWVGQLIRAATDSAGTTAPAVVFRDHQRWYPFPGLYRCDLIDALAARLQRNTLALQQLLDDLQGHGLPLPEGWAQTIDVNKNSDLGQLKVGLELEDSGQS